MAFTHSDNGLTPKTVSFPSGNGTVLGHLYLPQPYDSTKQYPAVAVGGSQSSVKEMMSGNYAGELARRGMLAMAIDYRNFGESSGAARQLEDPESKAVDLSAALEYLSARPDVASTGLLGICTSAGNILYTAASDPRAKSIATVAGFFSEPALLPLLFGEEGLQSRKKKGQDAQELYKKTGEIKLVPAYSPDDPEAASMVEMPYYIDQNRGAGVRAWRNTFAVMGWEGWLTFDPISEAPHVKVPSLVIHSEQAAFPDQARKVQQQLGGPKEIIWQEGEHLDFYDVPETVGKAADALAGHFLRTLS